MINSLVSIAIFVFVFVFVNRIFGQIKKHHVFPLKLMTNFGTFYFIFLFGLYFYFFAHPFWFWLVCFLSLILFPAFVFLLVQFHQQQFYSEFLRFLSMVILAMRRGLSYSAAMEVSIRGGDWKQGQLLRGIYENVVFSQQEPVVKKGLFGQFIHQIHVQLKALHHDPHRAIDRLCNFRKNLLDRLNFRRKSRQIWAYFGFQLGLLSFIYFGLLAFVAFQNGFHRFKTSFLLSFLFYLLGLIATLIIARLKKWHI